MANTKSQLEPEYAEAYAAWQAQPSPQTRSALLTRVRPVLDMAVKSYGAGAQGSPTLRSHAKHMSLQAFTTYDPQRGKLRSHLLSQLQGLRRLGAKEQQIISLPERVALGRQHLWAAETELQGALGREPSAAEVAERTGLSLRRIAYIRQGRQPINTGAVMDTADPSAFVPASKVPGQDPSYDSWVEYVYSDLRPTDQTIMDRLLGLHGQKILSTTALAQHLGLTPGAISQRAEKIQAMLDERTTLKLL